MTTVVRILLMLATVYGALLIYLYFAQENLIFAGTKLPADHEFAFDVPFEEVTIAVDGAELNALHFRQPETRGLVFFLHGNGGDLESWTTGVQYWREVNYDLFMLDYRGYGKSTGSVESQAQLHDDVRRAWERVVGEYDDKPKVIYGRSLGAALAIKLASDVPADLVVLVSPFSSMLAMARSQYPFVPNSLLRYPLRNDVLIGDIETPLLFFHGDRDSLIPLSHSERLLELANAPAELQVVTNAGHNDVHEFASYLQGLGRALP